jgi:hypothetical protein
MMSPVDGSPEHLALPERNAVLTAGARHAARSFCVGSASTVRAEALLGHVIKLTSPSSLRAFFGVARDDQCRKFHVEVACLRLVTTYLGRGTEWIPDDVVDRDAMARMIPCPEEANAAIVRDHRELRHADAGDVVLLKGSRHPDGSGAVHRSPPIVATGVRRVVLVVTAGGSWSP